MNDYWDYPVLSPLFFFEEYSYNMHYFHDIHDETACGCHKNVAHVQSVHSITSLFFSGLGNHGWINLMLHVEDSEVGKGICMEAWLQGSQEVTPKAWCGKAPPGTCPPSMMMMMLISTDAGTIHSFSTFHSIAYISPNGLSLPSRSSHTISAGSLPLILYILSSPFL